jgi:hypothetical protein
VAYFIHYRVYRNVKIADEKWFLEEGPNAEPAITGGGKSR